MPSGSSFLRRGASIGALSRSGSVEISLEFARYLEEQQRLLASAASADSVNITFGAYPCDGESVQFATYSSAPNSSIFAEYS